MDIHRYFDFRGTHIFFFYFFNVYDSIRGGTQVRFVYLKTKQVLFLQKLDPSNAKLIVFLQNLDLSTVGSGVRSDPGSEK